MLKIGQNWGKIANYLPNAQQRSEPLQFTAAKETKNNGIIKQLSKMVLYEKNGILYTFRK